MAYTVNKLAKISGVSVRTLHFYDEIGLLKPAYYGSNNYRYYEEEQLLMLQQILFYRELSFSLTSIQQILNGSDFDKIKSLNSHKHLLELKLDETHKLIKTIDKTISHLKGKGRMNDIEMYDGFDAIKQQEREAYLIECGALTQAAIDASWDEAKDWNKENWEAFHKEGDTVAKALSKALTDGLQPDSIDVQCLIELHYNWVKHLWTPTRDGYIGLSKLYIDHSDFSEFYNGYHPQLLSFLVEAMKIYADKKLS